MSVGTPAEIQRHPYAPFLPAPARALILGSAPPWRFCAREPGLLRPGDLDYYYGSAAGGGNLLWDTLFLVLEPSSLPELLNLRRSASSSAEPSSLTRDFFQSFLSRHQLGMADILLTFSRQGRSSTDQALRPREFTPLLDLLAAAPQLQALLCTSRRVCRWLEDYLWGQGCSLDPAADAEEGRLILAPASVSQTPHRLPRVLILPSPSPLGQLRFPSRAAFADHLAESYARALLSFPA